jgi:hypothetical protein
MTHQVLNFNVDSTKDTLNKGLADCQTFPFGISLGNQNDGNFKHDKNYVIYLYGPKCDDFIAKTSKASSHSCQSPLYSTT